MRQKKKKTTSKADTYHHGDLKSTLIESALRLIKAKGPENLSLRELAREAGVSQAAPYRHFKDKKELLAAIIEQGFEKKYQYMYEAIESAKNDPKEMYFACGLAYFRMGLKHPQHFKLMTSSEVIPDPAYPSLLEKASSTFILLREMIKYSQKKGIVGKGDPYHKAMNCWCVVNGFTALYAEGRLGFLGVTQENAEECLRALLTQYLKGQTHPLEVKNIKLFETPQSKMMKEMVLDRDHPQVSALFSSLP